MNLNSSPKSRSKPCEHATFIEKEMYGQSPFNHVFHREYGNLFKPGSTSARFNLNSYNVDV
jgi:hypothetical protein